MALDVENFIGKPQTFEGLYKFGETQEREKLKKEQLAQQAKSQKTATANFLQNYLDPKDMLSGTAYDPMLVKGLNDLMQQGSALAASGVDAPTLMMTLGPGVNKLATYAQRAKTINGQVDDQIKKLKESGESGLDFAKLKDEAMKGAFYRQDPKAGSVFDITVADPSVNYVDKVLADNPEGIANAGGLDEYAKKTPMNKSLADVTTYDKNNKMNKTKVHLIGQTYMTPEYDDLGNPTGMVPKYEIAHGDDNKPMMMDFKDKDGKVTQAPMRMLDETEFDKMMGASRSNAAMINADTKKALAKHEKETGEKISLSDPKAKLYARGVAYDELKSRSGTTIENAGVYDKQSGAEAQLNIMNTPEGLQYAEDRAAAVKRGQNSEPTQAQLDKANKSNPFQTVADAFAGKIDNVKTVPYKGKQVLDITSAFPGGGLKKGRGENEAFKSIYFDPKTKQMIVTTEEQLEFGQKKKEEQVISEAEAGPFMYQIAEANGINRNDVKATLEKMGYKNGRFAESAAQEEETKKAVGEGVKGAIDKVKGFFKGSTKKEPAKKVPPKSKGMFD